jgi:hypothetical protein
MMAAWTRSIGSEYDAYIHWLMVLDALGDQPSWKTAQTELGLASQAREDYTYPFGYVREIRQERTKDCT